MEEPQPKEASTTPTADTKAATQGPPTNVEAKGMATRGKRKLPDNKVKEPKKPKGADKPATAKKPDSLRPAYRTTAEGRRGRERLAVDLLRLWEPFAHPGSRQ